MFIWDIIIDNSTFTNNRANYRWGALYAEGKLNISNSNFSNNKVSMVEQFQIKIMQNPLLLILHLKIIVLLVSEVLFVTMVVN